MWHFIIMIKGEGISMLYFIVESQVSILDYWLILAIHIGLRPILLRLPQMELKNSKRLINNSMRFIQYWITADTSEISQSQDKKWNIRWNFSLFHLTNIWTLPKSTTAWLKIIHTYGENIGSRRPWYRGETMTLSIYCKMQVY